MLNAAIFDMDGLLLDTEPLWGESMLAIAEHYRIPVTLEQFRFTTGLRIYEVTSYWKEKFPWPGNATSAQVADDILDDIISRSKQYGRVLPGVAECLQWMQRERIKTGVATSSPMRMLNELIDHFDLRNYFNTLSAADTAQYGKPHPEVYLRAAASLQAAPFDCVAFEDSVNGMVAAKAARMRVVVVPGHDKFKDVRFGLAEMKLRSLEEFGMDDWKELIEM